MILICQLSAITEIKEKGGEEDREKKKGF